MIMTKLIIINNFANNIFINSPQILSQSFVGHNMSTYFPEVAKLLVHTDVVIKKMACWFISRHCSDSNQTLLVLNSLFGFVKQPNPVLRILALQTLANIPLENHLEFVLKLVGWLIFVAVEFLLVGIYIISRILLNGN